MLLTRSGNSSKGRKIMSKKEFWGLRVNMTSLKSQNHHHQILHPVTPILHHRQRKPRKRSEDVKTRAVRVHHPAAVLARRTKHLRRILKKKSLKKSTNPPPEIPGM